MTVADRIRQVMEARGLTIDEFAALLGDKPQRLKDVLRGKQRAPEDMLVALAKAKVDIGYLLTGIPIAARQKLASMGEASRILQEAKAPYEVGAALLPLLASALEDGSLTEDETELLSDYRGCTTADKTVLRQMAERFASDAVRAPTKVRKGKLK